ncbi:hypothetical protein N665_0162s0009 [Sinapis alba]|nr:hypothetical protein N665_0162s0009 [Sinapis alba]
MSFMDAFSDYNHILMQLEDQEKTSFMTSRGIYCYKVISFGLKNAGSTYRRLVNMMFAEKIGKTMEVYIEDMLVKSLKAEDHISYLQHAFSTLRKYNMKLNTAKCSFGVNSGKFLGYIVTHRGIEANPQQIRAIQTIPSPRNIKEVQKLTKRMAALGRFISRFSDKSHIFFEVLKNPKHFQWSEKCESALEELKINLTTPPLLSKPHKSFSYTWLCQSTRHQEKLAMAVVVAAQKLRPYFQAHQIVVITSLPIKTVLHKPKVSGRLAKGPWNCGNMRWFSRLPLSSSLKYWQISWQISPQTCFRL